MNFHTAFRRFLFPLKKGKVREHRVVNNCLFSKQFKKIATKKKQSRKVATNKEKHQTNEMRPFRSMAVVLNLFHCWDPPNATDVVWDPQVKIEKVCAPE